MKNTPNADASLAAVLTLALACHGCATTAPLTVDALKNATYTGIDARVGAVTLAGGRWTGAPAAAGAASRPIVELADDFHVGGDLDGDGRDEAVVILTYSAGGTGTVSLLAVVSRTGGALRNVATTPLGDRVEIRSVRITGGRLLASGVRAGPADAACCPGELVDWQWTLGNGRLNTPGAVTTGRLSLDTLAGMTWVLRAWDVTEAAGSEPAVSLAFDAGRFTGSSGCNRYSAGVEDGVTPGEITVGPVAGTRMACPELPSSVEARFLEQLGGARTFGFFLGRLAITYRRGDGSIGTMLFQPIADTGV